MDRIFFGNAGEQLFVDFLLIKVAFGNLCGSLTICDIGTGIIDGFAVFLKPCADGFQGPDGIRMKAAIGLRSDVQPKVAVLGDDIGKLLNDTAGRFVFGILDDAPGNIVFQAVIRLPWEIHALREAAAFQVLDTAAGWKILLLIGQNALGTGFVEMPDDLPFIRGTDER